MTDLKIALAMAATTLGLFTAPLLTIAAMTLVLLAWYSIQFLAWWDRRRTCGPDCDHCPDPIDVAQDFHDDLDRDFALWARECGRSA